MKSTGGVLIALGAIALLLWAEHRVVHSSRDAEPLKQSALERALMPDSSLGKAPTLEGLERWSHRRHLAHLWIHWVIPGVGIVLCLGGLMLKVTSRRAAAFVMPDAA